ncbi:Metal-dependent hydrolase related to alanyl-tRNA synthetase [Giardia lamblia P15]|uniref:Metal-dependent hydrolase related to alanyl-tRNA synthetase n=1 Tax=Giardia intestinalis (strain P15) TaxID=658858 RepID=E1F305_GIAIA|nr:Metal-dependent hydrolase related to alanyl-tRNA synthetase [Giardia lamblia P15]
MEYLTPTLSFTAKLVAVLPAKNGNVYVRLSHSYFFPQSGGQLGDVGSIGGLPVITTNCDEDHRPLHLMATAPPSDTELDCSVNAVYRRQNSISHTGQHIFSNVAEQCFQAITSSYTMGPELSTLELSVKLDMDKLLEIENRTNDIIRQCIPVKSILIHSEEELGQYSGLSRSKLKSLNFPLRIVDIEGVDVCLCCGTHASNTGECGLVKVFGCESSRGGVKVQFAVGDRAISLINNRLKTLSIICASLTTGHDAVVKSVETLLSEGKALRAQEKSLIKAIIPLITPAGKCLCKGTEFSLFNTHDLGILTQSDVTKIGPAHTVLSVVVIYKTSICSCVYINSPDDIVASTLASHIQELITDPSASLGGAKGRYNVRYVRILKDSELASLVNLLLQIALVSKS